MYNIDSRTQQAAELFVAAFAGRTDAYSVWTGEQWRAIRQPLTGAVVLKAFETKIPVSAYFLAPDSASHLCALDIDREDGLELGRALARTVNARGGIGYLEKSRRGCHFWIVLDDRRPALLLRRALRGLIAAAGLPTDPKIELRPGSDRLSVPAEGGEPTLGHCLRMPTMPHPATQQRSVLISSDGDKLSGKLAEMMLEVAYCPSGVLDTLAEEAPLPKMGLPPKDLRFPYGDPVAEESASDILRDLWGVANAAPGRPLRCPAHPDKRASLSILKDDQRAICHATGSGCVLHNNDRGRGTHELRALAPQRGERT